MILGGGLRQLTSPETYPLITIDTGQGNLGENMVSYTLNQEYY